MKTRFTPILTGLAVLLFSTATLSGCKSKKGISPKKQGEVLLQQYCSPDDWPTTKKEFRATGIGESLDQMTAKKKARSNAMAELGKNIAATMKIVGDNYVSSTEVNNVEEVTESFNEMSRTVVDEEIQGSLPVCTKFTKTEEGKYKCYMAIELSGEKLIKSYNKHLSKNEKLKADYNYEKFKETFEKEMAKLEKERGY